MRFFYPGEGEQIKTAVHAAMLGLFAAAGAYNAVAWLYRREKHLALNTLLYAAGAIYEHEQVSRHRSHLT